MSREPGLSFLEQCYLSAGFVYILSDEKICNVQQHFTCTSPVDRMHYRILGLTFIFATKMITETSPGIELAKLALAKACPLRHIWD